MHMSIFQQERFQGKSRGKPYFEGYYFRAVTPTGRAISIIPGISLSKDESHCFVQIIDSQGGSGYFRYPVTDFEYSDKDFFIKAGENAFSNEGVSLSISRDAAVFGTVFFKKCVTYPHSVICPNIMGPFSYVPFLECRHGVVCIKSGLEGEINLNGEEISFNGGAGYIEKDWGSSFPSQYVWAQSSAFSGHDASFMLSVARVPVMGRKIRGLIAFLYSDGRFYRFTTYDGACVKQMVKRGEMIEIVIKSSKYTLFVCLEPDASAALKAPVDGAMNREIRESGNGSINLKLFDKRGIIFSGKGKNAAIEICGDVFGPL